MPAAATAGDGLLKSMTQCCSGADCRREARWVEFIPCAERGPNCCADDMLVGCGAALEQGHRRSGTAPAGRRASPRRSGGDGATCARTEAARRTQIWLGGDATDGEG